MSTENEIIFHHIRNCTNKVTYTGLNILEDPFFAPKGHYQAYEQCPIEEGKKLRLPIVDLPIPIDEIIKDLEYNNYSYPH